MALTNGELKALETEQKRNSAILKALEYGYTQADIARYLQISPAAVYKVFKGVK